MTDAARKVLDEAAAAGVRIEARLWASNPARLPPDLLARLRLHRPAVLRLLTDADSLSVLEGGIEPSHRHNPTTAGVLHPSQPVTPPPGVTDRNGQKSPPMLTCDGVTGQKEENGRQKGIQVPQGLADVPPEWRQGIARLATMPPPATIPDARWTAYAATATRLLREHGAALHRAGWDELALFGLHAAAPAANPTGWGLAWLLGEAGEVLDAYSDDCSHRFRSKPAEHSEDASRVTARVASG